MLTKNLTMLILALSLFLTSCGDIKNRITIHNTEWWVDKGREGAKAFNTLNNHSREWDKTTWDTNRFGMVCGVPASIAEILSEIEKFCNTFDNCEYDTQEALNQIVRRVNYITESMKTQYSPLKEVSLVKP